MPNDLPGDPDARRADREPNGRQTGAEPASAAAAGAAARVLSSAGGPDPLAGGGVLDTLRRLRKAGCAAHERTSAPAVTELARRSPVDPAANGHQLNSVDPLRDVPRRHLDTDASRGAPTNPGIERGRITPGGIAGAQPAESREAPPALPLPERGEHPESPAAAGAPEPDPVPPAEHIFATPAQPEPSGDLPAPDPELVDPELAEAIAADRRAWAAAHREPDTPLTGLGIEALERSRPPHRYAHRQQLPSEPDREAARADQHRHSEHPRSGDPPPSAAYDGCSDGDASEAPPETDTDDERPWPDPLGLDAFYGIAGEFCTAVMPHTEADQAALLFQFLAAVGCLFGNGAHTLVEDDRHTAKLNVLLCGATSKARKGTSFGRVRGFLGTVAHDWASQRILSGLSTGEGLIMQVRDARTETSENGEEKITDQGEHDKRLLVVSTEFASVLRVMARPGNTLSSVVRDAWDQDQLRTLTKNSPLAASGAHISQIGHVTVDELRRYLDATEMGNGFANRFLFVCARRARVLPFGGGKVDWTALADRMRTALAAAKRPMLVEMDADARQLWAQVYPELSAGKPGMLGAVTARAEAQTLRLALVYCLLDATNIISATHLRAALECWRYAEQSARHVFGNTLGDGIADTIAAALRRAGRDGMTRTDISNLFGRNLDAGKLTAALALLARAGRATATTKPTNGRPVEIWRAMG